MVIGPYGPGSESPGSEEAVTEALRLHTGMPVDQGDLLPPGMEDCTPEMVVAEGMAFAHRDMMNNGPLQPTHRPRGATMTRGQLEEQKMNEKQGYPSNLDEASKVKELEANVGELGINIVAINRNIGQLGSMMQQLLAAQTPQAQPSGPPVPTSPGVPTSPAPTTSPLAPSILPLPVEAPVSYPTQTSGPPSPPSRLVYVGEAVPMPPTTAAPAAESPSTPPIPTTRPALTDQDILDVGRAIAPPGSPVVPILPSASGPLGMGPAPTDVVEDEPIAEFPKAEEGWEDSENLMEAAAEEIPPEDPMANAIQNLVQGVFEWMPAHDPHRFFRRHIVGLNRHFGYASWPQELKAEFDERFKSMLTDPVFVGSICKKILSLQMGHGIAPKTAAGLIAAAAGFMSFSLCQLD